jgi:hypothetical protein
MLEVRASLLFYWCLPADLLLGVTRTRSPACGEAAAENLAWPA